MIPATHWADGEDGTAWVVTGGGLNVDLWDSFDRPCGLCDPHAWVGGKPDLPCGDCDGTGRHTFDVEVGYDDYELTYRVSVVPGMILPIVAWGQQGDSTPPHLVTQLPRPMATLVTTDRIAKKTITLPPAAKPGMWAIQLRKADR